VELHLGSAWGRCPPHVRRRDALLRRSLGAGDVAAAYLALVLAAAAGPAGVGEIRPGAILLGPVVILLSKALGLYDRDQHRLHKTTIDEAPALLHVAVIFALTTWLAQDLLLSRDLTRTQVLTLVLTSLILTVLCRVVARAVAVSLSPPERCLVVGEAVNVALTAAKLTGSVGARAEIVGSFSISGGELRSAAAVGILREMITRNAVERVVVAPDSHDADAILHCIRLVKALGVKVSVVPRIMEVVGTSAVVDDIQGTTLLGVRPYGLSKSSELLKRVADIVAATAALVVLAPLLITIGLVVCLDSRGGPLYRQRRIGCQGRRFWMYKFRSMVAGADRLKEQYRDLNEVDGGLFKIAADPRITRVGSVLRRTCLDELPQLLNVLKGDMSLVGPRPLVIDEDALIRGWERRRLAVKPGMTGLWQIFGSSRIPLPEMVKLDYIYGANWSVWLDLKILLRTIPYVLSRRGV
jgi:exopolysaccharide biosynthesis polyprenyl glycosylphosphotransferase